MSSELKSIISERITKSGKITFAEYMASALYEPKLGYYTSAGRKVGKEGDFYTSISVHSAFGKVIAKEFAQMWRIMGEPSDFTLVEAGAGHGQFAADIVDYIAENEPKFYDSLKLVLIEKEPTLEAAQRATLATHSEKLSFLSPEVFESGQFVFSGCLYSNELIDAFPLHKVFQDGDTLKEIYVTLKDNEFLEELGEPSTNELQRYLDYAGIKLYPGKEAEINLNAAKWLLNAAASLKQGFIFTIDYGYLAEELFAPHRKDGTLLCYYRHQAVDNPYIRLGEQDITSHIDFSNLMKRGNDYSLQTEWFGEQYRFLIAAGIIEEIEEMERSSASQEDKLRLRLALKRLIMPEGGMGDTFKILVQSKNIESAPLLCKRRLF